MNSESSSSTPPGEGQRTSRFSFNQFRKLRFWFGWPFVVILAVYAHSTPRGFLVGIPIIVLGEGIRIWSHGYLRKLRKLATDGPYAHVRNPLYVGNFLIGLGFCCIVWNAVVSMLYVVGFSMLYWVTIKGEEEKLVQKFGASFREYAAHVPRLIPNLSPYRGRSGSQFAIHRVVGHGEVITLLAIIGLSLLIYMRQELYQNSSPMSLHVLIISLVFTVLTMSLIYILMSRRIKGRKKYVIQKNYQSRRWRNWQTRKT